MKDLNENELIPGDLLILSQGNYLLFGIYKKTGGSGNLNFYPIGDWQLRANIKKDLHTQYFAMPYNAGPAHYRQLKISSEYLTEEQRGIYNHVKSLL